MSDIKVVRIIAGELETNTYICAKGDRCFLVDPTGDVAKLNKKIADEGLQIDGVLLTHGHFDHCMLAKYFQNLGIKIYIHTLDADKLYSDKNLASMCGVSFQSLNADVLLNDGDVLNIANIEVKVMLTQGHSVGSVCYVVDEGNCIFVGDLLFKLSYGRTDFFDGNFNALAESCRRIFSLSKNYILYTGHGDITKLEYERKCNIINVDARGVL
ncbi:MAG: MBL fold metallo-hydrolase [Clostridia bacterium]